MEECKWINALRELPPENKTVLLRTPQTIQQAQYGEWHHLRDGEYESWYYQGAFIGYLNEWQYWMEIPKLP